MITSYALPPQSSLTCAPSSLRTRISKNKVERRTYVSTKNPQPQITLFHELTEGATPSDHKTVTHRIENTTSPTVYIGIINAGVGSANTADLLAVHEDGEIRCYSGSDLEEKWVSPAAALSRDVTSSYKDSKVEFAQLTNAFSASQGILKGRQDALTIFPQEVTEDGFNPEILVLITKSGQDANTRTLHIVTLPRRSSTASLPSHTHSVESLLTLRIPSVASARAGATKASFNIQASAGILQQLEDEVLTIFDLNEALPKQQSSFRTVGGQSFLRLTNTSIMVSSERSIAVYNPKFRSMLASVELSNTSDTQGQKRKRGDDRPVNGNLAHSCKFVAYFPKLGSAVAILDNQLVGVQLEGQHDRQGRLRAAGLLIDSIGRSVKDQSRPSRASKKSKLGDTLTLGRLLPGSLGQDQQFVNESNQIDSLFSDGKVDADIFDNTMASALGVEWSKDQDVPMANGDLSKKKCLAGPILSQIDRRWAIYALSKIFAWSEDESNTLRLTIQFYPPHTFLWLMESGQMTVNNVELALRKYSDLDTSLPLGLLVESIVEIDRDMDLLLGLLANNYLGAAELLHAIRKLMESLGLLGQNPTSKQKLLTGGDEADAIDGELEEDIERLEAEIETDLELAEYQLGPGSGLRGEALSIALAKLYRSPKHTIVYALQTTFTNQEVVCLIYLLRFELAKGAWTTKYTDADEDDMIDEEAPETAIVLLSSLLNNCIDAIGAGGWLTGEARLMDGDPFEAEELIGSLKLEVSAAMEGIMSQVYFKGIFSEMIKYGDAVTEALPRPKKNKDAPIILRTADEDLVTLPMGLKAEKQISLMKVGVGGAIHQRTMRDVGHQKSQKVGKYTRERIVV